MSTPERLAFSLREERRGIHVLLWDNLGELLRTMLIIRAVLGEMPSISLLLSGETDRLEDFVTMLQGEIGEQIKQEQGQEDFDANEFEPAPHSLWILFLQQSAGKQIGSRLNGWRRPMSQPEGTLFVVRNADFEDFQRGAPDLASFIGPRIYDASQMLMLCSSNIAKKFTKFLPESMMAILKQLPGTMPSREEIANWSPIFSPEEG